MFIKHVLANVTINNIIEMNKCKITSIILH